MDNIQRLQQLFLDFVAVNELDVELNTPPEVIANHLARCLIHFNFLLLDIEKYRPRHGISYVPSSLTASRPAGSD